MWKQIALVPRSPLQLTSITLAVDVFIPNTSVKYLNYRTSAENLRTRDSEHLEKRLEIQQMFGVSVYAARGGVLSEAATQILEIFVVPLITNSTTIMVKATSDAFFEGVYPVRAHVWGMDKDITVEQNSKPVLTRRKCV
ncbi:unnamed protein product [Mesocestoides corti]|uniref:Uncharacterized protein n=2 Tax=Mesocestoides corti TaxID=53468 RepID=A0A0R3UDI7_MESCO|nr:unnamed protein product [Mesocestoides corti]